MLMPGGKTDTWPNLFCYTPKLIQELFNFFQGDIIMHTFFWTFHFIINRTEQKVDGRLATFSLLEFSLLLPLSFPLIVFIFFKSV